ncbi:Tigger transposable element derived 6 [Phytophthora megakarya]|uniref:Tigger transposable element derived 6 n=1 Tax=Phytophthora megakarya TaxID=4795 RepID=A0A225VG57_9STRA|nr:Tigger transposable element derived 6 [Phytophthora megakarya]
MDEDGLCYNRAPVGDIYTRNKLGVKPDKTRITVVFCANADGSEMLPLLYIGRAFKPHCFKNEYWKGTWIQRRKQLKSLDDWLCELDVQMRGEHRHILLLLDNTSPHKSTDMTLTNVTVKMLPPNTTPFLQPMDAGIVAAFKACYRLKQIQQANACVDSNER